MIRWILVPMDASKPMVRMESLKAARKFAREAREHKEPETGVVIGVDDWTPKKILKLDSHMRGAAILMTRLLELEGEPDGRQEDI